MKRVLVTTDFSSNSKAGIRFAIQMAAQSGCELEFYNTIEIMKPTSWSPAKYHTFSKVEIERSIKKLRQFVGSVLKEMKNPAVKFSFRADIGINVQEMVIARAKKIKADFICLGTRGAGTVRKLFGTHASGLINNSPIPVITVPASYRVKPIKTFWYSSDFENPAQELKQLIPVAEALNIQVETHHYNYLMHDLSTKKSLNLKAKKLESKRNKVYLHQLGIDYSLTAYMENAIKKNKPSAVVLFTKQNRNWFSRLFLSSKSAEMSFATHAPLVVFRKKTK